MNILPTSLAVCLSSLLVLSTPVLSQEKHHEHREHGAHEHGAALLNVAIDDQNVQIELESPAMNIVGFEHPANSQGDKQAVIRVTKLLKNGGALFVLPKNAQCGLIDSDVESPLIEKQNHSTEHSSSDGHTEFHANYEFKCKNVSALNEMDIQLLHTFEGIHELRVQMISDQGQSAKEMTVDNTILSF